MPSDSAAPHVVKLADLTDIATAVPYTLGFQPTESLVATALKGPRERMSFTMRLDLLPPEHDAEVARMCAARMARAKARAVLLVLYTAEPRRFGALPRADLVARIQKALPMPLRDAALVDASRVWSYLCAEPACCPPQGRPLLADSPGSLRLAAANALVGNAVLPDRDALVATAKAVKGVTAASMRQAIDRALDGMGPGAVDGDVDEWLRALDELCTGYAAGPMTLPHDDAARCAVRVHDVRFRDTLIGRLARGDDALLRLITDVARLAQPPYDAPAATMLGMGAYFRGDGVVALAAAERALATDEDYSLAQLLMQAVTNQLDPKHIRRIWAKHAR